MKIATTGSPREHPDRAWAQEESKWNIVFSSLMLLDRAYRLRWAVWIVMHTAQINDRFKLISLAYHPSGHANATRWSRRREPCERNSFALDLLDIGSLSALCMYKLRVEVTIQVEALTRLAHHCPVRTGLQGKVAFQGRIYDGAIMDFPNQISKSPIDRPF